MKGKPKSQRAILLAAAHCKHPELDAGDKALLMYLALNADFGTGENSHPGNRNIADALKLTDPQMPGWRRISGAALSSARPALTGGARPALTGCAWTATTIPTKRPAANH